MEFDGEVPWIRPDLLSYPGVEDPLTTEIQVSKSWLNFTMIGLDSECLSAHGHEASDGKGENAFEHSENKYENGLSKKEISFYMCSHTEFH